VTGRRQLAKRSNLKLQLRHSREPVPDRSESTTFRRQSIRPPRGLRGRGPPRPALVRRAERV
jgi:hypothetical protein